MERQGRSRIPSTPGRDDDASERPRVLMVDDDKRLLAALRRGLSLRSFHVDTARDAHEAMTYLETRRPDVVVLDIMMPGMDGLDLCRLIRDNASVPILMLTARDSVPDRVAGLEAGADDYLVKPFDLEELLARIRALLRRAGREAPRREQLSYADLTLDLRSWAAHRSGEPLPLTAKEFRLLEHFMRFPERVLTREDILAAVWGQEWLAAESNVVDVHVGNLREKREAEGRHRLIKSIRGVGYMLKED